MNISTAVELHARVIDAQAPILMIKALGSDVFGELVGPAFAEGAGFTPQDLVFEAVDPLQIGEVSSGFLMKLKTASDDFDIYFIWFAQGRISAQLIVMGPAGQVALKDVIPLAQLMGERIVEVSP